MISEKAKTIVEATESGLDVLKIPQMLPPLIEEVEGSRQGSGITISVEKICGGCIRGRSQVRVFESIRSSSRAR